MVDAIAGVLILVGVALAVTAGLGLQRFPDVFARMHAATKPATLGLVLVLAGAALRVNESGDVAKLLLVLVLQFITAPVGAHMVGRAAYRAGTELSPTTSIDELARDRGSGWEGEKGHRGGRE
ncbi:MAG TPA: monovalent cation/H(+) antiporter subunit G [Acidimicrobiales bacterium]|nr:monovalent cation/H(+) antiporter subunit G [Acidimicrobiales bacterium]